MSCVYGRYRVAWAEPRIGERANFGVVLWGVVAPVRVAVLPAEEWPRFEAFTGFDRAGCEGWLRGWATPEGLAAYARGEERGSIGQDMSVYKLTEPLPAALDTDDDPLDGLVDAFLRGAPLPPVAPRAPQPLVRPLRDPKEDTLSDDNRMVASVGRPLSEIVRIYATQTTDPAMMIALTMMADDVKKLEDRLAEVEAKHTDGRRKDG